MNHLTPSLAVNSARMHRDFEALAQIGATAEGGVHRPSFSEAHLAARAWFRDRAQRDGFDFRVDGAGNHSAVYSADGAGDQTLLLGSHLDSVPFGGKFDGALGVIAAYEVVRTIRDAGVKLPVRMEAIDFSDEEGTLVGLLGSRAVAGSLPEDELAHPRAGRQALLEGLQRAGLNEAGILGARRPPESLRGFLELHVEQGPRLLDAQAEIGVVSEIVGIQTLAMTFLGRADHAGTTPMPARRDAGIGAATFMVRSNAWVREHFTAAVINFGQVHFEPGAYNIVPARAVLSIEFRAPDAGRLDAIAGGLREQGQAVADSLGLNLEWEPRGRLEPVSCSAEVRQAFREACRQLGLKFQDLSSGAGHDTMAMAKVCPAGMIFVPSTGGSHSYREHAEWEDCVNGANVLLHAALRLSGIRG